MSPTGILHIGGIRTALFNFLYTKSQGGDFILRIEDTDRSRYLPSAEKYIIDALRWIGIEPDESPDAGGEFGPYRQSERLDIYKKYADKLISSGDAYYAFDSSEELDKIRKKYEATGKYFSYNSFVRMSMKNSLTLNENDVKEKIANNEQYVIRFKMPKNIDVKFDDKIKGIVSFNTDKLDDKILFKSDGYATYHLASVSDDHDMQISHVIRADEWINSTPLHILLYKAFGWDIPEFCHLPLVLGPDKQKLSKRHAEKYNFPIFPLDADYVKDGKNIHAFGFREAGFNADALINYISLLGWSPGNNVEFMNISELISLFDLEKVNNSGAIFDIKKLEHFNSQYLRAKPNSDLWLESIAPNIKHNIIIINESTIEKIINIAKERSIFAKDLYPAVSYFFEPVILNDDVVLKNDSEFRNVMKGFLMFYTNDKTVKWNTENIKKFLDEECESRGFKIGKILPDLRMSITGGIPGPHLPETMEILGQVESIKRIKNLLEKTKTINV